MRDEFEIFARKEGQDISIGKVKTEKEAVKILAKKLKTTIAASGFIEKSGQKISVKELGIGGKEFRISKIDPYRLVQKKGKRLGTKQETESIQFFRKSGRGGPLLGGKSRRSRNGFNFF